jgi:minor extracellular serine protease Vpr
LGGRPTSGFCGRSGAAGAPGVGNDVIGVASFDNSHVALNTFTISPDNTSIGYCNAASAPHAPTSGSLPMATVADVIGCAPLAAGSLTGKAALISRGTCTFAAKAANAQAAVEKPLAEKHNPAHTETWTSPSFTIDRP